MFEERRALMRLKEDHPDMKMMASGFAATMKLELAEVIIDPWKESSEWTTISRAGVICPAKKSDLPAENRLMLLEISDELQRYYQAELAKTLERKQAIDRGQSA